MDPVRGIMSSDVVYSPRPNRTSFAKFTRTRRKIVKRLTQRGKLRCASGRDTVWQWNKPRCSVTSTDTLTRVVLYASQVHVPQRAKNLLLHSCAGAAIPRSHAPNGTKALVRVPEPQTPKVFRYSIIARSCGNSCLFFVLLTHNANRQKVRVTHQLTRYK
jgi:hypothetical protein